MWDTTGGDLSCMASEAFSSSSLPTSLNQGPIKLITNNASRDTIGGWRPIIILSISYKIMDKALPSQMQRVSSQIVSQEQMEFVHVISAWEAMEWARETGHDSLFLKVNLYKAYDLVDWSFITKPNFKNWSGSDRNQPV